MAGINSNEDCDYREHHQKVEVVHVQIVSQVNKQFFYEWTELVLIVRDHDYKVTRSLRTLIN